MQGARAVWVAVGILALAFLVGVLAPAWYFAGRLVENNTAVRAIGELQQQPSRMQAALNSIQDRLRARGFVRDSIEQLKRATAQFQTSTASLKAGGGVSIGGIGGDDDVQKTIAEMNEAWKKYKPALDPVANFTAIPYSDSEREGTQLNMDGRELQRGVTNAVTQARAYTPALEKGLAQIIAGLQSSSDSLATALRSVVLIGVGLAAALAALVGYLSLARGKQAAAAAAARQQTEDILSTVPEGLFLLSGDLKTGFTPGNGWGCCVCIVREPQGVSAALSPGSYGHGGAYGTQAWIDPVKKVAYVLMVQRANFPNSDGSDVRKAFQDTAAAAMK
jgi:hypothetical protein